MGYHPTDTPLVAVHTVITWEALCHDCGWGSEATPLRTEAEAWAEAHDCWRAWRDSNPRPPHP